MPSFGVSRLAFDKVLIAIAQFEGVARPEPGAEADMRAELERSAELTLATD